MYILYMLVLNNTPFVHTRVYIQYLKSALLGADGGCVLVLGVLGTAIEQLGEMVGLSIFMSLGSSTQTLKYIVSFI